MKITILTDTHWRYTFPHEGDLPFGEDVFYLGDNVELVNFKKQHLLETLEFGEWFYKKCFETNTVAVKGNHEGGLYRWLSTNHDIEVPVNVVKEINGKRVLFCHGLHNWKTKRVQKWWDKPLKPDTLFGSKFLKSMFSKSLHGARKLWPKKKWSRKQRRNNLEIMKQYDVDILIQGHVHPTRLIDETHDGKRMICCMQGKTILDI